MAPYGPFHPTAWAIIHCIEAFGNAGTPPRVGIGGLLFGLCLELGGGGVWIPLLLECCLRATVFILIVYHDLCTHRVLHMCLCMCVRRRWE